MGFIGKNRGKAISTGGGGGSFSRADVSWLGINRTLIGDPGGFNGHVATGGVVNDYTTPTGKVYRSHTFTSSGVFEVTEIGTYDSEVEYLVVAGGGGAGGTSSGGGLYHGGGGAGGCRTSLEGHPAASPTNFTVGVASYTITVGAGGAGGGQPGNENGFNGTDSALVNPTTAPATITSTGGGGGGHLYAAGSNGGSGGGGGSGNPQYAGGEGNNPPVSPPQGNDGGAGNSPPQFGGGGGGWGAAGSSSDASGGAGLSCFIAGPPTNSPIGTPSGPSPGSGGGWFGGGGAGVSPTGNASGGAGGGANEGSPTALNMGLNGTPGTGGGGGTAPGPTAQRGGAGGSGIVAIRYQIADTDTKTAKATGGAISFYNGKTIHAFTNSGTLVTSGEAIPSAEVFMVAGGGGGGFDAAGGGGAGGVKYRPDAPLDASTTYTITIGGGGVSSVAQDTKGSDGSSTVFDGPPTSNPGIEVNGGGGGGSRTSSPGEAGGSGGGGGRQNGTAGAASGNPTETGWTNYGNDGGDSGNNYGTGGGGAGSQGEDNPSYDPITGVGGGGGIGIQAPATFRNPEARIGGSIDGSSDIAWGFAGGGGGGANAANPAPRGGSGGAGGSYTHPTTSVSSDGPHYGGGAGAYDPNVTGTNGERSTGGGGGGGNNSGPYAKGFEGGSGIVLVAYPT